MLCSLSRVGVGPRASRCRGAAAAAPRRPAAAAARPRAIAAAVPAAAAEQEQEQQAPQEPQEQEQQGPPEPQDEEQQRDAPEPAAVEGARRTRSGMVDIKVSGSTDPTKAASFMCRVLGSAKPGEAVRLRAAGPAACFAALKTVAKATTMLQDTEPAATVAFRLFRRSQVLGDPGPADQPERGSSSSGSSAGSEGNRLTVFELYAFKTSAEGWAQPGEGDIRPMRVSLLQGDGRGELARLQRHVLTNYELGRQAVFRLAPPSLPAASKALASALTMARRKLLEDDQGDFECSVATVREELPRRPSQQQQQQQAEAEQAAESAPGEAAAAGDGEEARPWVRVSYLVTARPSGEAPARGAPHEQPDGASSGRRGSRAARAGPRPGMVEVPEEEWQQLREQLELVPHLTEQLQTLTRQHEQLLSLLSQQQAQGGQQE